MNAASLAAVLVLAGNVPLGAQVALETEPRVPVRGSLLRLMVSPTVPAPVSAITGTIGTEPLHLETTDGVRWSGLAGIPLEGGDSVSLTLVLQQPGQADTILTRVAVETPHYAMERLEVAPSMAEPDSAARVRIAEDGARARAVGRAAHGTPRQWQEPFALPRDSRITSTFGTGREFNGKVTSRHMGTDLAGMVGDPVLAVNRGRVALVADFYLAGTVVYVDHGMGLVSAYFHLSRTLVTVGDEVELGQPIGEVGRSGRVTGPHLHWVMRYGGVTVDPMSVLALTGAE